MDEYRYGALGRRKERLLKAINNYVGENARAFRNRDGDLIVQSEDNVREVRFDFNIESGRRSPCRRSTHTGVEKSAFENALKRTISTWGYCRGPSNPRGASPLSAFWTGLTITTRTPGRMSMWFSTRRNREARRKFSTSGSPRTKLRLGTYEEEQRVDLQHGAGVH